MKRALLLSAALTTASCTFGDNETHTLGDAAERVLRSYCEWTEGCYDPERFEGIYIDVDSCVAYWMVFYNPYVDYDLEHSDWPRVLECEDDMSSRECESEFPASCVNILDG